MIYTQRRRGRCPTCGADHAACGAATTIRGADEIEVMTVADGEEREKLRVYTAVVNGVSTRLRLKPSEAARMGLASDGKPPPHDKQAHPKNKGAGGGAGDDG